MSAFNKASYAKKGEAEKKRIYDNRSRRGEIAKQYVWEYLSSHPCVECGQSDPRLLEFDHIDPKTKRYNVSNMTGGRPRNRDDPQRDRQVPRPLCGLSSQGDL
jgi:hypothetical protein